MRRVLALCTALLLVAGGSAACGADDSRVRFADEGDRCADNQVLYLDDEGHELRCEEAPYRGPLTPGQRQAVKNLADDLADDGSLSDADKKQVRDFAADPTSVSRRLQPEAVAVGEGAVWVLADNRLLRVDPTTRAIRQLGVTFSQAMEVAAGEGAVWVLADDKVVKVDPVAGTELASGPTFDEATFSVRRTGLAVGFGAVWVQGSRSGSGQPAELLRFDARTMARTVTRLSEESNVVSRHLLAAGTRLWSGPFVGPYVMGLDPATRKPVRGLPFSPPADDKDTLLDLAVDAEATAPDALWVVPGPVGTGLLRIDLRIGKAAEVIGRDQLPGKYTYLWGVAVVAGTPWVVSDKAVHRVDVAGRRIAGSVELPGSPERYEFVSPVYAGFGDLWVMGRDALFVVDPATEQVERVELPTASFAVR